MSRIFVPPRVVRELAQESRQWAADLDKVCHTDQTCEEWTRELQGLDSRLRMVRAPDRPVLGLPLYPGCYHVIRDNDYGAPPSVVTPVRGPDGGFIEPPGRLLDALKEMDLQNSRVVAAMQARVAAAEAQQEREKANRHERKVDEIAERWDAATRTQVSMNPDTPWAQNAAGLRQVRNPKGKR
jgi:hypothetical protein